MDRRIERPHVLRGFVVLALAAALGCGGGVHLEGDVAGDGDAGIPDGARDDAAAEDVPADAPAEDAFADDAGTVSCDAPYHWELVPRTIPSVEPVDGLSRFGATDRLRVQVQLTSACEFLGRVDVVNHPGDATDFVELAAWAWAPVGLDCPPSAPLVPWIVTIPGRQQGNLRVVVADRHSPGGALRLEYGRDTCSGIPECMCYGDVPPGTTPEGGACVTDCSCAEGLACIGYFGVGGPLFQCLIPCNDLLDCARDRVCVGPVLDGPGWVCESGSQCDADADCPAGFVCEFGTPWGGTCRDLRPVPSIEECSCDEECPAGFRCVVALRERPVCEVPCLRDVDCPAAGSGWLVCGNPSICLPLD